MNQRENVSPLHRAIALFWLLTVCVSFTGCSLSGETRRVFSLAKRTTHIEPRFYEYVRSDRMAQREARMLAEQAWAEVVATVPNASPDYANGFTEGFADYLYRGGSGNPPAVPPRGYWHLRFLNQFGKTTTKEWYDGFRHGAQDCKSRGLREMWIVPSSLVAEPDTTDAQLPSNPQDLWSADPDNLRQPTLRAPTEEDVESKHLEDSESPPVPELAPGDSLDDSSGAGSSDAGDGETESPASPAEESLDDVLDNSFDEDVEPNVPPIIEVPQAADPFGDDADIEPETPQEPEEAEQDPFNLPRNGDMDVDLDDFDLNDTFDDAEPILEPFSNRSMSPSSPISANRLARPNASDVQQASREVEAEDQYFAPIVNKLRQRDQRITNEDIRRAVQKEPPLQLIFEGQPTRDGARVWTPAGRSSTKSSQQSDQQEPRTPESDSPQTSRVLDDYLFDESVPTLPLLIGPAPASQAEMVSRFDFDTMSDRRGSFGHVSSEAAPWTPETSRADEIPLRVEQNARPLQSPNSTAEIVTLPRIGVRNSVRSRASGIERDLPKIIDRRELPTKLDSGPSLFQLRIRD